MFRPSKLRLGGLINLLLFDVVVLSKKESLDFTIYKEFMSGESLLAV